MENELVTTLLREGFLGQETLLVLLLLVCLVPLLTGTVLVLLRHTVEKLVAGVVCCEAC